MKATEPNTRHLDNAVPFRVVPMRFEGMEAAARLSHAIAAGMTADEDPAHPGFFTGHADGVTYYFHVFDRNGTVYLVADTATRSANEPESALVTH